MRYGRRESSDDRDEADKAYNHLQRHIRMHAEADLLPSETIKSLEVKNEGMLFSWRTD